MFGFIVFDLLAEPCEDFLHFLFHLFEECDDFAEGGRVFLFQFLHHGIGQEFKKILAVQLLFSQMFNYILFHVIVFYKFVVTHIPYSLKYSSHLNPFLGEKSLKSVVQKIIRLLHHRAISFCHSGIVWFGFIGSR